MLEEIETKKEWSRKRMFDIPFLELVARISVSICGLSVTGSPYLHDAVDVGDAAI